MHKNQFLMLFFIVLLFTLVLNGCLNIPFSPVQGPEFSKPGKLEDLYEVLPDIRQCYEGVLKEAEKQKALEELNFIRNLHNLNPVTYDYQSDIFTAKAALIIAASKQMSHFPDSSLPCWTQEGYFGSSKSNLYWWGWYDTIPKTEDFIKGWVIDDEVESLGHRKWLLNPFLEQISFGRVDIPNFTGAAIRVIYDSTAFSNVDFVAYPYEEYPRNLFLFDWYFSFTAIPEKHDIWANERVDFSRATIEVTDEAGNSISVHSVRFDNEGFGVPNNLQWKCSGLQYGKTNWVKISNVRFGGRVLSYEYWFRIM